MQTHTLPVISVLFLQIMIIGPTIANWHKNELVLSAELIDRFIDAVESQALESIERYRKGKQCRLVEFDDADQTFAERIEEYRGLGSDTWDLQSLFEEYFPSLQRRSAFLTVWGYFEHELDKLCSLYKAEKNFRLDLSDMNGHGIDRSTRYLEKVAGINVQYDSQEWKEIKKIRELRNKITHQDGRLLNKQGRPAVELISYVEKSALLKKDGDGVILKEGFLKYVVDVFSAYFGLIAESIKDRETATQESR